MTGSPSAGAGGTLPSLRPGRAAFRLKIVAIAVMIETRASAGIISPLFF